MKINGNILIVVLLVSCHTSKPRTVVPASTRNFIQACADSINSIDGGSNTRIPAFLTNPCLDYQKAYWPDLHHPVPLRRFIIANVKNKIAIEWLLSNTDSILNRVCNRQLPDGAKGLTYYTVPELHVSYREMFRERLAELGK